MYNSAKSIVVKVAVVWVVFALLHFANDIFPNPVLAFFGEKEGFESIFGHAKMNFWTYLFVTIGEFLLFRQKITDVSQFWLTRLLTTVLYPWFAQAFWMTNSALMGGAESPAPIELTFAFLANVFGAYLAVRLEQIFDAVKFRKATQGSIALLFLMTLLQYIVFEINKPWWNFFGSH